MSNVLFRERLFHWILKVFLSIHSGLERRFFYYLCKIFGKPHPKNEFDFRTRDFLAKVRREETVADLGCGTGKLAKKIAEAGPKVLAVDRNVPNGKKSSNFEFVQMDLRDERLTKLLEERNVDCVVLSHILEHIDDSVGFLRRLKGAKRLLICVPSEENWKYQLKKKLGLDPRTDPEHFREYSKDTLAQEIHSAGWELKEIFYNSQGELFAEAIRIQ